MNRMLLLAISVLLLANCNSESSYEERRQAIAAEERADPARFLDASGTYRHTVLGQRMKLSGTVMNRATIIHYRNIQLEVTYSSVGNEVLGTEIFTLDQSVMAGQAAKFTWKITVPNGCEKLGLDVISATPY